MLIGCDDYIAILNLFATYNHRADGADPEALAECYTEDGKLVSDGQEVASGRVQIADFRRRITAAMKAQDKVRRHFTTDIQLEALDQTTVKAQSYMQNYNFTGGSEALLTHALTFEDLIVKRDGRWQFARRSHFIDFAAPEFTGGWDRSWVGGKPPS